MASLYDLSPDELLNLPRRGDPGWIGATDPTVPGAGNAGVPFPGGQPDPFDEFDPTKRSPNTGVNGGAPGLSTGGANGGDFGQFWMASGGRTVDDLKARVAEWNASHPGDPVTLGGSKGDKPTYRRRTYDAVIGAGAGGQGASWSDITDGGGGAGGGSAPYLDPYTKEYKLPTADEFYQMPGVQASLNQIQQGGERSAAARGTLLTPGTQLGINRASSDYIGNQYATLAGLGQNAFGINRDIFYHNQDEPYRKLYNLAALGKPGAYTPPV